jgi:ubiquinone/menaquinone biosynthesis C-methylase UbiE
MRVLALSSMTFDAIAPRYDELWTRSPIGRLQRDAVWRRLDDLFRPGNRLLDLGCGTGEDALHFMSRGMEVSAIDASPEMVRIAHGRGVDANVMPMEELERIPGCFDGVISNFGGMNCVENLAAIRSPLARLLRPGGHLAVCVMGRFCLWETAWYALRAEPKKTLRRWKQGRASSLGVRVFYPSVSQLSKVFASDFELVDWYGVGIAVPPSFVTGLSSRLLTALASFDRRVEHLSPWRALSDHRLLIFRRREDPDSPVP